MSYFSNRPTSCSNFTQVARLYGLGPYIGRRGHEGSMTERDDETIERIARAIREEIVRQYRDDDRGKCPAGVLFWEEEIQPILLAEVAMRAHDEHVMGTKKAPDAKAPGA